jgi:hypothetical protein
MLKYPQVFETKALASNGSATLQIPTGGKIHGIQLRFATSAGADVTEAAIRAEIASIKLSINGTDHVQCSPTRLLDLYEFLGRNVQENAAVASVVELIVGKYVFTDPVVREAFGLGTADVQSIQVQVVAGTLSTIDNVQAFVYREINNTEKLGTYCKFIDYPRTFNATGDDIVSTLPRDPYQSYLAVLAYAGASGVISHGAVKANGINIMEKIPAAVNKLILSNNRYAVPASYFPYSFIDGSLTSRLPMAGINDLQIATTFSTASGAGGYNLATLVAVNYPNNIPA